MKVAKLVMSNASEGDIHTELLHDPHRHAVLDLSQLLQGERVHRLPKLPVIQHPGRNPGEPIRGGGTPPVRERRLRARGHNPVQRRQRRVRAGRRARIRAPRPEHRIDDAGHVQPGRHAPDRGDTTEGQMTGPLRQDRVLARVQQRLDLRRAAQVALRRRLRLAFHPRHLTQVPVRLPADYLLVQARHDFRS
jgi:hypothetical protein